MAFTIRVELHSASPSHYQDLARKLAAIGIVDVIRGDDGTLYKMPPAEYYSDSSGDINTIRQACAGIAASVVPSYAIFVTEGTRWSWQGLQTAR